MPPSTSMDADTYIGGPSSRFPDTHLSAIRSLASDDSSLRSRAWEQVTAAYWKPVYKYIRIRWREDNESAKDLTQSFFARAIEKNYFDSFDPDRATFRTYLRVCLDRFLSNERASAARIKRSESHTVQLDTTIAAGDLSAPEQIEEFFHQEWRRSVLELSVERLRSDLTERGRTLPLRAFERYDLGESDARPTYTELAAELGTSVTNVTNYLAAARRDFRRTVLQCLRELTASDQEFRAEASALFGENFD